MGHASFKGKEMSTQKIELNSEPIFLGDEKLFSDYTNLKKYKTILLGQHKNCKSKFKIEPIHGPIFSNENLTTNSIKQGDLGNCHFLSVLRSLVRHCPDHIKSIIQAVDSKLVDITLMKRIDGELKPLVYRVNKTRVVSNNLSDFFVKIPPEAAWVKLLEKTLVLSYMQDTYSCALMNYQEHQLRGKYPTYNEVLQIASEKYLYEMILGCEVENMSFLLTPEHEEIYKIMNSALSLGEFISVSFKKKSLGLISQHAYEVVNIGFTKENEKYVLLSNPWGHNKTSCFSSRKHLPEFDTLLTSAKISDDDSIIGILFSDFQKIIKRAIITKNARLLQSEISDQTERVEKNSLPHIFDC